MSRGLTVAMLAQLGASSFKPIMFYEGLFNAGAVRLWTGLGPITWDAKSWVGAGTLLGVSGVTETADLRAESMTLSLSGMTPEVVALALTEAKLGLGGSIWFGVVDDAGAVVADPFMAFHGQLDVPSIRDDGQSATVSIRYENHLKALKVPKARRYTHEDMQIDTPGEMGCQYVHLLPDQNLNW